MAGAYAFSSKCGRAGVSTSSCQARGSCSQQILSTPPCRARVAFPRGGLDSGQVVAVDPDGFRHRAPGQVGTGRARISIWWVRSCRTRRVCRHLARGHCTGYAFVSPTQAWAARLERGLRPPGPAGALMGRHAPARSVALSPSHLALGSAVAGKEPSLGGKRPM